MKSSGRYYKTKFRIALTAILLSFFCFQSFAQLSGTYTINPAGGDFASDNCKTVKEAIDSLHAQGVGGPVVFNIAEGTYNEQNQLNQVTGASSTNTITFQSADLDSTKVILTYASTGYNSNWTLRLNGADYVKLRKMTIAATNSSYARCIDINGTARYDTIENCQFYGYNTTSSSDYFTLIYSYDDNFQNLVIQNNLFANGSYGLRLEGSSSSVLSPGTEILNNEFFDQSQYGMWLEYHDAPVVNNNILELGKDPCFGIYFEYCDNAYEIQNNKITLTKGDFGIYLYRCDGAALSKGLIASNIVSIQGIGSNSCGIYLSECTYQNIYHNSVNLASTATGTGHGAFYLTAGANIDVRNNIFVNFGGYYAYNIRTTSAITNSNYNNYYSTGNFLAYWGANIDDLEALQTAQTDLRDTTSFSFNPNFLSVTDLHTTSFRLDDKGFDVGIATDIDEEARTYPDIGAYEFTGSGTALAGPYTIGGSTPDFVSFSDAVDSLFQVGISSSVIFNVRDFSYEEQIKIYPIDGSDFNNTVTFQSESGDSAAVEISYNSGSSNNYIVSLQGADYVSFKKMTFTALNNTYSSVIWFGGNANNDSILNCIINGEKTGTTTNGVVDSWRQNLDSIVIANNLITGAKYGIILNTDDVNVISSGTKIYNNKVSDQRGDGSYGIYLRMHDAPEVYDNIVDNSYGTNHYGINLRECPNSIKIYRNKITTNNSYGGIRIYLCVGTSTKRGLVVNNFIQVGGIVHARGICTYDSDFHNIYYNSVNITSTNSTEGRAFYNYGGSTNIKLINNIFSNFGGGYAFYTDATAGIDVLSDYNDYYATGNYIAYWDGINRSELVDFQTAASPREANSISANPSFVSETDLHTTSSFLNDSGTVIGDVTDDIDGEARDGSNPDMGADEFTTVTSPLAGGTYTIGGTTPNYEKFSDAVDDLNTLGISGPVVFDVRDGYYEEQISIFDINGADEINTITFQSESGDSTMVELFYTASVNYQYVVELVGTDYITFKDMTFSSIDPTYSEVFYFKAGLDNVSISNCVINGTGTTNQYNAALYADNATFSNLTIQNNVFTGGWSGVWITCIINDYAIGTKINNNTFSEHIAESIYLRYHDAPEVSENYIDNSEGYGYFRIYLYNCSNALTVSKNIIIDNHYGGIYLYYCDGNIAKKGLIANNFVDIGGTAYGYGIHLSYSDYQRIYNNSVRITSTHTSNGRAFYNYNGDDIDVQNNIFANFGGGYAFYANNITAVTTSNHNDLFTTGNYIGYWDGNRTDLVAFQTANEMDANSISTNPVFVSADDMHTTSSYLDSAGFYLTGVITDDIDGDSRDADYPDIGADEFIATTFPLSGEYFIGGDTPDYETFTEVAEDLNTLGIDGPVTFNVRSGIYVEQFELYNIAGASATDTIIFQSESGDSTDVIVTYDALSENENYVVKLSGADYVTIKNMQIVALNSTYGKVIVFNGSVNNINILNNIINTSLGTTYSAITNGSGNITNYIIIKNNIIIEGGDGIHLHGISSDYSEGIQIINNTLQDQDYTGIYITYSNSPEVISNNISTTDYSWYGIKFEYCNNDIIIKGNKISNNDRTWGIQLTQCNGSFISQGLIANNFISIQCSNYAYGIIVNNCQYQNIYHNSVNIASTYYHPNYRLGVYIHGGGANINIKNNNFANTNGGYAYYIESTTAIDESDNNNLYSTENIAYWGSARSNIAALNAASLKDGASISANPLFVSATDLHTTQVLFHKAATGVAEVTDDIDGHPRDETNPDIGAVEFYCETPNFDITASVACFGDSTILTDNSTNVSLGATYSWDFNADWDYDTTFISNSTVKYLFETSGSNLVLFIIEQIAGCIDWDTVYANVSPPLDLVITTDSAYCDSANGQAYVSITGEGDYTYYWSTGDTDSITTGLAPGTYTVAVRDSNNCSTTETAVIEEKFQVTVTELGVSSCGISDGEAVVSAKGGVEPYSYVWSNGEVNDTNSVLAPGVHYVNVIDAMGCYIRGSVNIGNDGTGPQITQNSITSFTDLDCYEDELGIIDLNVTGGSQPYSISWSNGADTSYIDSLAAGIYDILVLDADSCMASASFEVTQPPKLSVLAVIDDANCAASNGKVVAVVSGGTAPYLYSWSSGGAIQIEENLAAGIYSVTVVDSKACQTTEPAIVNNVGGPVVSLVDVTGVTCSNTTNGAIDISVSGGTPPYSQVWSPGGETTQDISNLTPGVYEVRITDATGCVGVQSAKIKQDPPETNSICLVTVDSITGMNQIMWEKGTLTDVDYYNIYRESSQAGVYQLIGTVPVDSLSLFTDSIADPNIRSWRYKISVVDVCGNESDLSDYHKTMHLTQNVGLNNTVNLIWDHYEGFSFSTYDVWRFTVSNGWEKLQSMPNNLTSYTDLTPPAEDIWYMIEVLHPSGCTSTKASSKNSARSNLSAKNLVASITDIPNNIKSFAVYPNPNSGIFNIVLDLKELEDVTIRIFDISGTIISTEKLGRFSGILNKEINLPGLSRGMYYIQVITDKGTLNAKVIIE